MIALVIAATAVKFVVGASLQDHPLLDPASGTDPAAALILASRAADGDWLLRPGLYFVSPLYIYFLALILKVGGSVEAARAIQILLGVLSAYLTYRLARLWQNRRSGLIAGSLVAGCGVLTLHEVILFQGALDSALTAALLFSLSLAVLRARVSLAVAAGAIAGLNILNRPNVWFSIVAIVIAAVVLRQRRTALALAIGVSLALSPVVLRNRLVAGEWALSPSHAGLNFFIGNNPAATGQYVAVSGVTANILGQAQETRRLAEHELGRPLTDSEVSSFFFGRALKWIKANPGAAARLFFQKLGFVFSAQHQWLDFSYPYYSRDYPSRLWLMPVGPWLLVPMGLGGLLLCVSGPNRLAWTWVIYVPSYAIGVATFFVAERYRAPLFIPLAVGAGMALDRLFVDPRPLLRDLRFATAVIIGGLIAFWPHDLNDGRVEERLKYAKILLDRHETDRAITELQAANAFQNANPDVEFHLGVALVGIGRRAEGIEYLRLATSRKEAVEGRQFVLAKSLQISGDSAGAAHVVRTMPLGPNAGAESLYHGGMLAAELNIDDIADTYFRGAIGQRPEWPDAKVQLGVLLIKRGQFAQASDELVKAIALGVNSPSVEANLAYCLAILGRYDDAGIHLARVRELDPSLDVRGIQEIIKKGKPKRS